MISFRKNTRLRIVRSITVFMAMVIAATSLYIYAEYRLRSVVIVFGKSAVETAVLDAVNRASMSVLGETPITYDKLAVIKRNSEGLATSVEIDSLAANRLKSQISDEISKDLAKITSVDFSVPLYAAFGMHFVSARYPMIPYKMQVTTTVQSNIESTFSSAGINQVLHQIILKITLKSDLAVIGVNTAQITGTEFIIAQTVIVGAVPDAFTSVGHATDEVIEDIFDFGASASE